MKKVLSLLMVLALCLSLVACGKKENSAAEDSDAKGKAYAIGETIKTEQVEFTVKEYGLDKCLSNVGDENYMTPIKPDAEDAYVYYVSNNPYNADDEHIILHFEFEYKNIGKEKIYEIDQFTVEYGDGYVFDGVSSSARREDGSFGLIGEIEPLSGTITGRAAVKLPKEVAENEDKPILVKVKLPSGDGETTIKFR